MIIRGRRRDRQVSPTPSVFVLEFSDVALLFLPSALSRSFVTGALCLADGFRFFLPFSPHFSAACALSLGKGCDVAVYAAVPSIHPVADHGDPGVAEGTAKAFMSFAFNLVE